MYQLLTEPNTGQYVQYSTGWYRGCLLGPLPMTHGLSNMFVQDMHVQGIRLISNLPLPNIGSSRK